MAERPAKVNASILVVDDEPTIGDIVARYLVRAGFQVHVAADGPQAIAMSAQHRPDLVVLDIMLPGFDGLEVMRRLHEGEQQHRPAIILLTARGEESDRIVGLRRGADDYVVKPFSPGELLARVQAVLRRSAEKAQDAQPLELGGLRIDPAARTVTVGYGQDGAGDAREPNGAGGQEGADVREVPLTQREFDLLLFLARNPGRAFSRDELMEHVWRLAFYNDSSTVTVHIRRLRAKIERQPEDPRFIQTVWGVGYRFSSP